MIEVTTIAELRRWRRAAVSIALTRAFTALELRRLLDELIPGGRAIMTKRKPTAAELEAWSDEYWRAADVADEQRAFEDRRIKHESLDARDWTGKRHVSRRRKRS